MNPIVEAKRRINEDIKRYEQKHHDFTSRRRRVRREDDQIAYKRKEADYLGKIKGLKYALEHIEVSLEMSSRKNVDE